MRFLCDSERSSLLAMLDAKEKECCTEKDVRGLDSDAHLVFEAIHMLADGLPERLFAMIHANSLRVHPKANPGITMLYFQKIAENGANFSLVESS